MTNETIRAAIANDQWVYAILHDGTRDLVRAVSFTKVACRNGIHHLNEIADYELVAM